MNIDKNNISAPKQLIGGDRREKGVLEIFTKNSDFVGTSPAYYSTGLNGRYKLKLNNIEFIRTGVGVLNLPIQIISDTLRIDRGNDNTDYKTILRTQNEQYTRKVDLANADINNWIDIRYQMLGSIGSDIATIGGTWSILLVIEYERI